MDVKTGDRVVSILPNSAAWIAIDAACSAVNAIHVPLPPNGTSEWIHSACNQVAPRCVLTTENFVGVKELPCFEEKGCPVITIATEPNQSPHHCMLDPFDSMNASIDVPQVDRVDLDATFNILFTSGTSGSPKGVMLSHRSLMLNAEAKLDAMPQYVDDLRLNLLPFSHAYARTCEVSTWAISGSRMLCSQNLKQFWQLAPNIQPTLINAVPAIYHTIYSETVRGASQNSLGRFSMENQTPLKSAIESRLGSNIRMLASGGATLPEKIFEFFEQAGLPIHQGYGLTEASPVVCSTRWNEGRAGSVGPPVKHVQIRIDDDRILWIKGPTIMKGYWNNPKATQQRIVDGWLNTNDIVEIDSQGGLRILGRSDDIIVLSTGRKIAPLPIESALLQCEGVRAAVVIGEGQPFLTAIIFSGHWEVMSDQERLRTIDETLHQFASYMRPKRCVVINTFPSDQPDLFNPKGSPKRKAFEKLLEKLS